MASQVMLFKILPYIIYIVAIILSSIAGILVYTGLTSNVERIQHRIRIRTSIAKSKEKVIEGTKSSKAEEWLSKAQYPLGLTGTRYYFFLGGFVFFLFIYYVVGPVLINGGTTRETMIAAVAILVVGLLGSPSFPFSLFVYTMKRVIDYHNAKKHAEVFMLYDLLINEIEMMNVNKLNTYNVLRNIMPYFDVLEKPFTILLTNWSNSEGPKVALDKFGDELNSKEAHALIGVIKNLDDVSRETALGHLRGMHNMFVKSQIENYRRKRKVTTDLLGIPIKATHFIIILNFLVVVVTMVSMILKTSRM
ncbi:hypothetical protein [Robertmurraya sp. FSL R5-0851]|uniref:hypothetical protein n=1 Tax=Robertmurraya sp. FSL R5-0851 TaxID=2921584 RepID=UPI0030FC3EB9